MNVYNEVVQPFADYPLGATKEEVKKFMVEITPKLLARTFAPQIAQLLDKGLVTQAKEKLTLFMICIQDAMFELQEKRYKEEQIYLMASETRQSLNVAVMLLIKDSVAMNSQYCQPKPNLFLMASRIIEILNYLIELGTLEILKKDEKGVRQLQKYQLEKYTEILDRILGVLERLE